MINRCFQIAVVSGTRADYGLLNPVIKRIDEAPDLELQLILSAMHLSPEFGYTAQDAEADGFEIAARVEMLLSSDTPVGVAKSTGLGIIGFADAFEGLKPDIVVCLGDRSELLAAATAAMMHRLPIAHIHGGEATEAAIDEAIRHSVTKMSFLHFTSTDPYRQRVIQLGESPDRVFNVGALSVENAQTIPLMDLSEFESSLDIVVERPFFMVSFHPVTLEGEQSKPQVEALIRAISEWPDATCVVTFPNADIENSAISRKMRKFCAEKPSHRRFVASLGQQRYMSGMALADIVIGNSSSGLLEAPLFGTPTVDIGDRQRGRVRPPSVVHCGADYEAILEAMRRALEPEMQKVAARRDHPYGDGQTSQRIVEEIRSALVHGINLKKSFHTLEKH